MDEQDWKHQSKMVSTSQDAVVRSLDVNCRTQDADNQKQAPNDETDNTRCADGQ